MAKEMYTWTEDDVVVDHTRKVKKIWDTIMPEYYPYVLEFNTIGVKWVEHEVKIGPLRGRDSDLKYKVDVTISIKPLVDSGWTEDTELTWDIFKKAYGDLYDNDLRNAMRELLPHVGLKNISHFDFEGDLTYNLK